MDGPSWRRDRLAVAALAAAALAVLARYIVAGGASLTYNEATYVEMTAHPWVSSFYPDTVFLRHPPVSFAVHAAWAALFGTEEWVIRLPALAATLAGIGVAWDAAGRAGGRHAAALTAVVLGTAFPVHAYALKASIYALAFLWAAGAAWAHVAGRRRLEAGMLTLLALTHLFGFLFLLLWLWPRRPDLLRRAADRGGSPAWREGLRWTWPAWAWLGLAAALAVSVNAQGDIMRLGPLGQALRGGATTGQAVTSPLVHMASAALAWWTLNPVLLAAGWRMRRVWPYALAVAVLAVYLLFGAPFPRYALIPLPFVAVFGAAALFGARPRLAAGRPEDLHGAHAVRPGDGGTPAGPPSRATWTGAVVLVALLSLPAGFAYLDGPDPRAAGDVPGVQDWEAAVAALPPLDEAVVQTSGPTQTAYYLQQAGRPVTERTEAPYRIGLGSVTVERIDAPAAVGPADAWIVPAHWDVRMPGDARPCAAVTGLVVHARAC